jgi:hypothetical protein
MSEFTNEGFNIGYQTGKLSERERIIALLESKDEWHYAFSDVSDVIALIRGENE